MEGFYERLVRWIIVDDQVTYFFDLHAYRPSTSLIRDKGNTRRVLSDLLPYIGWSPELTDSNVSHSTKLGELIRHNEEYARMYTELIVSDLTFGVASVSGNRKDRL